MTQTQTNITLYNYFRSSTSYRVRIALEHKQIKYKYVPIHLLNNGGEQNASTYRELNPLGGVPTLQHDNRIISQSFAIIDYLEIFPQNKLFPDDFYLNAKVRQICENINADIHPLLNLKVQQYLEKNHQFTAEHKLQWMNRWTLEGLSAIETLIKPYAGKYCFGDQITAADVFLVPQIFSAKRFEIDLSPFPLLSKINDNCLLLESFQKAHPYRQIDTPSELKI